MRAFAVRSSTIRLGIFLSSLAIAAIVIFQIIWMKKIYQFEEKEFSHSVVKALRGTYEDLDLHLYYNSHLNDLIETPQPDLYLAKIDLPANSDSLTAYLHYELADFSVFTDCVLGIYDSTKHSYGVINLLPAAGNNIHSNISIPPAKAAYNHIALYFPNRRNYILSQMNVWIFSSVVLAIILILFGASIYYFYQQKFLNETQKDFIHNFTHEFKTPVAVMRLAAEVIKDPAIIHKPARLATYAGIVDYQSAYLQNQIEKLLRFANADSNRIVLNKERLNIHQLVQEAVSNLQPLILEKKVALETSFQDKSPFLLGDKDYLIIVIMNLLDNAIKYSKEPVIRVETENVGENLSLVVRDNGIGINKKDFTNIFKKFYRAGKGDVYTAKGFGIGLSLIQKIIRAHNGRIIVESEIGKGSSFTMLLPA